MTTRAQKDSICQSFIKKQYGSACIQLSERGHSHDVPPIFSNIQVVDLRRDTSRVGFAGRGLSRGLILFHTSAAKAETVYTSPQGNIKFRYEAYLKSGEGYIPLTYLDTLITSTSHCMGYGECQIAGSAFRLYE